MYISTKLLCKGNIHIQTPKDFLKQFITEYLYIITDYFVYYISILSLTLKQFIT